MARETITRLIDDLDGVSDADETIAFALDRQTYTIDLTKDNADQLREVFAPYVVAATPGARVAPAERPAGRRRGGGWSDGNGSGTRRSAQELAVIRSWARENGWAVSDRGRVAQNVLAAYQLANG